MLTEILDAIELGPCCACGEKRSDVRNVIMLNRLAPVLGTGWGCFTCRLPLDGAVAVVCDRCVEACRADGITARLKWVCLGMASAGGRAPYADLVGTFDHRPEFHPELRMDG